MTTGRARRTCWACGCKNTGRAKRTCCCKTMYDRSLLGGREGRGGRACHALRDFFGDRSASSEGSAARLPLAAARWTPTSRSTSAALSPLVSAPAASSAARSSATFIFLAAFVAAASSKPSSASGAASVASDASGAAGGAPPAAARWTPTRRTCEWLV